MRIAAPLSLLLIVGACSPGGCSQRGWVDVVSREGGFSVRMPAAPAEQTRAVKTVVGDIAMRLYVVEHGSFSYLVSFSDYPDEILAASTPERLLDGARDGAAVNIQGTVLEERPIALGDHPGRAVVIADSSGEMQLRMRLYLVGNRLYQTGVAMPRDETLAGDPTTFFDSFALLDTDR